MKKLEKKRKTNHILFNNCIQCCDNHNPLYFQIRKARFKTIFTKRRYCYIPLFYHFEIAMNNQSHQYFHFDYSKIITNE